MAEELCPQVEEQEAHLVACVQAALACTNQPLLPLGRGGGPTDRHPIPCTQYSVCSPWGTALEARLTRASSASARPF